jgi:hypothetical protein
MMKLVPVSIEPLMMPEIVKKDMELSNYCMGGISNHPTFRPYEY